MSDATPLRVCLRGATWRLWPCKLSPLVPNNRGYCMVYVRGSGAKNPEFIGIHRQALEQRLGRPVRPGYDACHHCDVRNCYEPQHLYEGTRKENMQDARERGRIGRRASLTDEQKAEVRRRYASQRVAQHVLAREFGVSQMTISNVIREVYS